MFALCHASQFLVVTSQLAVTVLVLLSLANCATDKRTVDPYPDRSYTNAVAKVPAASSQNRQVSSDVRKSLPPKEDNRSRVVRSEKVSQNYSAKSMLPMLTLVNDRIIIFEAKINQWDVLADETQRVPLDQDTRIKMITCRDELNAILGRYEELHQVLIKENNREVLDATVIDGFLATQRLDINFLEGDCQQLLVAKNLDEGWGLGTSEKLLAQREQELDEQLNSGNYQQAVELYTMLPMEEGQQPSFQATYNYGQALLRLQRENEAAEVFQNLLIRIREQSQLDQEFKLMKLIADIQFGMENYDQAFERYIHIINRYAGLGENIDWARRQQSVISIRNSQSLEVGNFAELIRSWLTYNPERDGFKVFQLAQSFQESFPDSSVLPTVNQILYESRDRAEAWFALVLQNINGLKGEKKYQEALQYIEILSMQEMPADKKEQLNMISDELVSLKYEEDESRRLAMEEELKEVWSKGQQLLRAKEYDQAIEVFSALVDTVYDVQAQEKIVEASQLAAQEDRRDAAELFVRASKSHDRNTQVSLLMQSRKLLQGILTKYPHSGLVDKAKRNLERIEDEIRTIDPALLVEPEISNENDRKVNQSKITTINGIPIDEWKEQPRSGYFQE